MLMTDLKVQMQMSQAEELRKKLPEQWPRVRCEKCGRTIAKGILIKGGPLPIALQCWGRTCEHLNVF